MNNQDRPSGDLSRELKVIFESHNTNMTSADYIKLAQIIGSVERWERKNEETTEVQEPLQGLSD